MKKTVAIIGGGPSALLAAVFLDAELFDITIYEKNKTVGRKFLVAGKGGFNLTHSEDIDAFVSRYSNSSILEKALRSFSNNELVSWLDSIGIPTYIGSSKRIYPEKGIKPIEVLNAILAVLSSKGVRIETEKEWTGWNNSGEALFRSGESLQADYVIFSLGGGSWKVTGSDGSWRDKFEQIGIKTLPFLPSNCAYKINWETEFIQKMEGSPLKNIAIQSGGKTCKGEVVVTQFGLEGNAIYALSSEIQAQLTSNGNAIIYLDLKPSFSHDDIHSKMLKSTLKVTDLLKHNLHLSKVQLQLIKSQLSKEEFLSKEVLSQKIKQLPLTLVSAATLDEAISTTGGISMEEISEQFELLKKKNTFCIGEMLDWNAPTGGYLLQGCFSTGVAVGRYLNSI